MRKWIQFFGCKLNQDLQKHFAFGYVGLYWICRIHAESGIIYLSEIQECPVLVLEIWAIFYWCHFIPLPADLVWRHCFSVEFIELVLHDVVFRLFKIHPALFWHASPPLLTLERPVTVIPFLRLPILLHCEYIEEFTFSAIPNLHKIRYLLAPTFFRLSVYLF